MCYGLTAKSKNIQACMHFKIYLGEKHMFHKTKVNRAVASIIAAGFEISNAYEEGKPASDHQQQSIDNSMEEVYDAQKLATALANGEAVFVNMTADWCITCKLNERIALSTHTVKKLFKTESIRYMKGDWTNSDAAITAYLAEFNRNGVPLYVYYAPDTPPVVLPQILTSSIIRNYIKPEK